MKMHWRSAGMCILLTAAMVVAFAMPVLAGTPEEAALAVYQQKKAAVVTVEVVVRQYMSFMGMGDESEESRLETTGTVIDATGLTVIALSATDPMSLVSGMMGGMMGDNLQMRSEVADVRILTNDAPMPAVIVLRDKDLDLAFVRPLTPPAEAPAFIDMNDAAQPALLDQVAVIDRTGKVTNRVHTLDLLRVNGIVERPRRFYLTQGAAGLPVGAPALGLDGRCVGIYVMRTLDMPADGGGFPLNMISGAQDNISVVLVPAAAIVEGALQAPAADAVEAPKPTDEEAAPETAPAETTQEG